MNKPTPTLIHLIWRLLLIVSLVLPATLSADVRQAEAGFGDFLPFVKLVSGMMKRNRVYREANGFIKDQAEYYDALRETARQQLANREIYDIPLRDNQVGAYTKVVALIEQERASMYDFAESEKKAARKEFIDTIQEEITDRMLASTPATRVLGAMSHGINSSQDFLDSALDKLAGEGGGFMEDVAKIRRIADRMTIAGQVIGGDVGRTIRTAGGKVVELIDKPTSEIEKGLIQVQEELGALGDLVSGLQGRGWKPTASQTTREVFISLVTGEDSEHAVINEMVDMLVAKHGGGGSIRDRAREIQQGEVAARCAARVEQIRQILYKMEVDPAGEEEDPPGMYPVCQTVNLTDFVEEAADAPQPTVEGVSEATDAPQPTEEEVSEATDAAPEPAAEESEYIWVLVNTAVNINNEPTSFVGGGADPTWFPEDRFDGKSLTFSTSAGSFSVHSVDVDHGFTYSDTTVTANFDSPPSQLEPGQEVQLSATASHSGSVNEGGVGLGLIFQYSYNGNSIDPTLNYTPWNPNNSGESTGSWTITAPTAGEGGEFTLGAGLWNAPPCNVIWTYQAQLNPNWTEETAPVEDEPEQEQSSSQPDDSWKEENCREQRQEVASKVDIARGADTADLALGIIGHINVARGDVQINYCEGGSGAAEKGAPIRVGDCIENGSTGRAKVTLNDRDDKYNADPTTLFVSRNGKLCFDSFSVHRDDGKPGLIDFLQGSIRIITRGWRPGSGLGVDVNVRAAVTVGSDVVLEYDPALNLLHTFVNEGSVEVADLQTGQSQQLTDNQKLISQQESVGSVEEMSDREWNNLLKDQDFELGESPSFIDLANISPMVQNLIGAGVLAALAALAIGGVRRYKRSKKES